ncbi:MAG: hypothetical protein FVQ82_09640 [Planctomycetes bacterium]|nr:hypothetical protein [Planctomycetota bacterium]
MFDDDDDDNPFELMAFKAFGVGLVIDLVVLSIVILMGFGVWGLIFFSVVVGGHLLISGWVMIFRWGCMEDGDYFFLRFGLVAVLLRVLLG